MWRNRKELHIEISVSKWRATKEDCSEEDRGRGEQEGHKRKENARALQEQSRGVLSGDITVKRVVYVQTRTVDAFLEKGIDS